MDFEEAVRSGLIRATSECECFASVLFGYGVKFPD